MHAIRPAIIRAVDALMAVLIFGLIALVAVGFILVAGMWWLIAVCWQVILPVIGLLYLLVWLA